MLLRFAPLGCLALLAIVLTRMPKFTPADPPNPPTKPVLALELPSPGDVAGLLRTEAARTSAAANTRWDYWFIAAYTLLFLSFAFAQSGALRTATIVVALATAALDCWEDSFIFKFIDDPSRPASDIWLAAQGKWFCFFLALILIAAVFARAGKWWWIPAILLAAPGLIGAIGALLRQRVVIDRITGPAIVALLLATLLVPFVPRITLRS